jgi:hypothetical protein
MGTNLGGRVVADRLEHISEVVTNYLGQQNELSQGLKVKDPIEKPDVLLEFERCERYHVAYYPGGLADQPHMWLLEQDIVRDLSQLFNAIPNLPGAAK